MGPFNRVDEQPHACSHDHSLPHSHPAAGPALRLALVITIAFMAIEATGGWISNSLALLTDAAHMLTDAGALLLSLFVNWLANRPGRNHGNTKGDYHVVELWGALISGIAIWILAAVLVYEAVVRVQNPEEVHAGILLVVSTIGLLANLICMKILHPAQEGSINVRAAYLHMLSDLLGSVGAIIAGIVLMATGWALIDPIITLIFSALMVFSSWSLVKEAAQVLIRKEPIPRTLPPELPKD